MEAKPSSGAEDVEEEESTISEGSLSKEARCAGWGGAVGCIRWAMYRGITKKGATKSKRGLKRGTTKSLWKKIYKRNRQVVVIYNESIS